MKYIDFKIFKFSTILKNIKRIQDSFSGFRKAIKNISRNITGYFGYIFSVTNKSIKYLTCYIISLKTVGNSIICLTTFFPFLCWWQHQLLLFYSCIAIEGKECESIANGLLVIIKKLSLQTYFSSNYRKIIFS